MTGVTDAMAIIAVAVLAGSLIAAGGIIRRMERRLAFLARLAQSAA
jgi:hypothetical protein